MSSIGLVVHSLEIEPMQRFPFLTLMAMALASSPAWAGTVSLVEGGQPCATIVEPAAVSPTVHQAVLELAAYVERISGAKLPIVAEEEPATGIRVHVGLTQAARKRVPMDLAGHEERVWIDVEPAGVTICGGSDRGTLFAVYRFLELLGCRWLAPGADHEFVPKSKTIAVEAVRLDTKPAFSWRLFKARKPEDELWGLKVGMNGFYAPERAEANGGCVFWPRQIHGVHAYHQIVPAKRYFGAHPEWNPLLGGERVPTNGERIQLCVTAPGLADEFAGNVLRAFEADPGAPLVSISPNDGSAWCECDACLALDRKLCGGRVTAQGLAKARPFVGDRVFWFANEVAERVARVQPDKKLLVLAYINYAEPPDSIRPRPNVVPFLCHYAPADYSRSISDPASGANRQFNDLLQAWVKISPDLMIYSYVSKSMWWRLPRPVMHNFAADVSYLHSLGVRRYYCQSSLSDWPLDGPLYYVITKLLWNPTADPDAIAREWVEGMFGSAAPAMTEFYSAVEAAVRKTGRSYSDDPRTQVAGLYERASLNGAMAAIQRAEDAAAGDEATARRVAEVARTFRYGYWMIEGFEQAARLEVTGDQACLESAYTAGQKALSYYNVSEAEDYVKHWKVGAQRLGVMNSGFGKEETKGDRRCWNSDETGPGDNACGWAAFNIRRTASDKPLIVEMDVWGESQLNSISIQTQEKVWTPVRPQQRLSRKPQWDRLQFVIRPDIQDPGRTAQHLGFGGGDSQIWVAAIRVQEGNPASATEAPK